MKSVSLQLLFTIYLLLAFVVGINLQEDSNLTQQYLLDQQPPKVFDCFIYTGEDTLLTLKLKVMSPFIDYFVIVEGEQTVQGNQKPFTFNMINFPQFSHKIIYLPLRNFPNKIEGLAQKEAEENKKFMENSFNQILAVLAHLQDIIILSEIDQIVSKSTVQEFKSGTLEYGCTEMLLYYEYFNRKSVRDSSSAKELPNYWYEGARLLTTLYLSQQFKNNTFIAHRSNLCNNAAILNQVEKKNVLKKAGWHFARVEEKQLFQKVDSLYIQSYFSDVKIEKKHLPDELVNDINTNQGLSKYARYIEGMSLQKIKTKDLTKGKNKVIIDMKERFFDERASRLVIECFPYNGEDHILSLKLKVTNNFVDYYIITEGLYSHTGIEKKLTFNFSKFEKYAHKIIYLPLRNFPVIEGNLSVEEKWENEEYMRNSANQVLEVFAYPQDILILSSTDQILAQEGFLNFDPKKHEWANTELRLYQFYFNRRSVYDFNGRLAVPNYLYNGIKITTFGVLKQKYSGGIAYVRRVLGCKFDVSSRDVKDNEGNCEGNLIYLAGWHFSSVLNNKKLLQKMKFHANSPSDNYTIESYDEFREEGTAPNAYTKDVTFLNGDLPNQLAKDIEEKGQNSQFVPYLYGIQFVSE